MTVGTHHQPFGRLLAALEQLPAADLVVQHGPGPAPAGVALARPFMPFKEMLECFRSADRVITHAGVGSIICATREGHVPLVVPRVHALGEHVDDHQVELTRGLADRGGVIPVWDTGHLAADLADAPVRSAPAERPEPALCPDVRAALLVAPATR